MNETAIRNPRQFLADLTQAMSATAETERQATIDRCRSDAEAHTERLRARTDDESSSLRKAAEADVEVVREWSKAEFERTRLEAEERVALRRRQLEAELEEYSAAVEVELLHVGEQIQAFEAELERFFERLMRDTDPTSFAMLAARMPDPPAFDDPDPGMLVHNLRLSSNPPAPAAQVSSSPNKQPEQQPEQLPDRWWLESPAAIAARVRSMAGSNQPG